VRPVVLVPLVVVSVDWSVPELVMLRVPVVPDVVPLREEVVLLFIVPEPVVPFIDPLFMDPLFIEPELVPLFMVPELFIDELLFVVVPVPLFMPLMEAVLSVAPEAEVPLVPLTLVVLLPALLKLLPLLLLPLLLLPLFMVPVLLLLFAALALLVSQFVLDVVEPVVVEGSFEEVLLLDDVLLLLEEVLLFDEVLLLDEVLLFDDELEDVLLL
jgi:hypothetical protein